MSQEPADHMPCPFCGCLSPKHRTREGTRFVECGECGARGPWLDNGTDPTDVEIVDEWNKRASIVTKPAPPRGKRKAQAALVADLRELFTLYKPTGTWFVCVRDGQVVIVRRPKPIDDALVIGGSEL